MLRFKGFGRFINPNKQSLRFRFSQKKSDEGVNYYETLGISQDSSFDEIKRKFKQLSKIYHPDYYKGSDNKFHQIQKAYKILSQFKTRKHHDINLGINNSLWQSQKFKLQSDKFDNEAFQNILSSESKKASLSKSLEQRLQQKFSQQINQKMSNQQKVRALILPSFGFLVFWMAWNIFQYIIINYKGQQSHEVKAYQGNKKLSAVPINIR